MTLAELRERIGALASRNMEELCLGTSMHSDRRAFCQGFAEACERILELCKEADAE